VSRPVPTGRQGSGAAPSSGHAGSAGTLRMPESPPRTSNRCGAELRATEATARPANATRGCGEPTHAAFALAEVHASVEPGMTPPPTPTPTRCPRRGKSRSTRSSHATDTAVSTVAARPSVGEKAGFSRAEPTSRRRRQGRLMPSSSGPSLRRYPARTPTRSDGEL
jgi:hypothetical protein